MPMYKLIYYAMAGNLSFDPVPAAGTGKTSETGLRFGYLIFPEQSPSSLPGWSILSWNGHVKVSLLLNIQVGK